MVSPLTADAMVVVALVALATVVVAAIRTAGASATAVGLAALFAVTFGLFFRGRRPLYALLLRVGLGLPVTGGVMRSRLLCGLSQVEPEASPGSTRIDANRVQSGCIREPDTKRLTKRVSAQNEDTPRPIT